MLNPVGLWTYVSVPVWPSVLSDRLPVIASVGRYPTVQLIGRGPLHARPALLRHGFVPLPSGPGTYAVLATLSGGYPPRLGRSPTCYAPGRHAPARRPRRPTRIGKHAASVYPEPGSNSPLQCHHRTIARSPAPHCGAPPSRAPQPGPPRARPPVRSACTSVWPPLRSNSMCSSAPPIGPGSCQRRHRRADLPFHASVVKVPHRGVREPLSPSPQRIASVPPGVNIEDVRERRPHAGGAAAGDYLGATQPAALPDSKVQGRSPPAALPAR